MKQLFALLALALVLVACSSQSERTIVLPPTPAPTGDVAQPEPVPVEDTQPTQGDEDTQTPPVPEEQDFSMDASEFAFSPSVLNVKEGVPVVITLTNTGGAVHGFALPDFNVNERIAPGETKTIRFTPDTTGSFRFFCSVPCGSGHQNMKGTIIVE